MSKQKPASRKYCQKPLGIACVVFGLVLFGVGIGIYMVSNRNLDIFNIKSAPVQKPSPITVDNTNYVQVRYPKIIIDATGESSEKFVDTNSKNGMRACLNEDGTVMCYKTKETVTSYKTLESDLLTKETEKASRDSGITTVVSDDYRSVTITTSNTTEVKSLL